MSILYFYQHLPLLISPVAFTVGSFSVRWYGLSYIVGFLAVYFVLMWRIKSDDPNKIVQIFQPKADQPMADNLSVCKRLQSCSIIQNTIVDFLLLAFFSALAGGRIGYVIFYNLPYFLAHPWAVVSPYGGGADTLIGIYGMSYHGALLGIILASFVFLERKKINFLLWADFVAPAAALGYFFGRLGNFLNGELYGRATTSPWGMYFLGDPTRLRYPSQLLEALLEGIALFVILWKMRKLENPAGTLFAAYLMGYGALRTFAELFRQPDPQLGFIFGSLTMGQILSLLMVAAGVSLFFVVRKKENSGDAKTCS